MTITELISILEAVRAEHGDLPIARIDPSISDGDDEPNAPLKDVFAGHYLGRESDPEIPFGAPCLVLD